MEIIMQENFIAMWMFQTEIHPSSVFSDEDGKLLVCGFYLVCHGRHYWMITAFFLVEMKHSGRIFLNTVFSVATIIDQ